MEGETNTNGDDVSTPPDVSPAFQLLRTAQDAETRAMETLLLSALTENRGDVDRAAQAIDSAIAQHRAATEELRAIRKIYTGHRTTDE